MQTFFYLTTEQSDWVSNELAPLLLNLLIAIIPSIIICTYVYKKDVIEKEPMPMLIKLFCLGILITIPASFVEKSLMSALDLNKSGLDVVECIVIAFLVVGLVEEGYKYIITYFGCWHNRNFDHVYDGIVYATFVSLGFAMLENILYVVENGTQTALLRAFISVPAHAFYAIACGYYLGISKLNYSIGNKRKARLYKFFSFIIPILLHGIFDFLLLTNNNDLLWIFFAFVAILYIVSFFNIRKLSAVEMTSSIQN